MSEEILRKHLEQAIAFQRLCMEDGDPVALYHAIVVDREEKVSMFALDASMFGDWETKNKMMAVLVKDLYERQGVCLALVVEAFGGRLPPHVDPSTLSRDMSQWPEEYRETVLLCSANAPGEKGIACHQTFQRKDGSVTYQPIVWWPPEETQRFCYDFRGVTRWQDAVQLVLLRGREGVVTPQ